MGAAITHAPVSSSLTSDIPLSSRTNFQIESDARRSARMQRSTGVRLGQRLDFGDRLGDLVLAVKRLHERAAIQIS